MLAIIGLRELSISGLLEIGWGDDLAGVSLDVEETLGAEGHADSGGTPVGQIQGTQHSVVRVAPQLVCHTLSRLLAHHWLCRRTALP